jgi:Fe-S-cluster containining protein
MTIFLEIQTANRRRPIARLMPATVICLLVSNAEAFHTSSTSLRSLKPTFGLFRRSFTTTNLKQDDGDGSNHSDDSSKGSADYDDEIALTQFLQKARDRALDAFAKQQAPSWMSQRTDTAQLPFKCTGCGKCCQTVGSVYMSPEEYIQAADYLNVTADAFVQKYASHTLAAVPAPSTAIERDAATATTAAIAAVAAEPWICLKDQTSESCIFLDHTTNHCQIYPVRPVQCRTYPFWPTVTASVESWNAECRRLETNDGTSSNDSSVVIDSDSDALDSSLLPRWTTDLGGCEGMRLVAAEEPTTTIGDDDAATATTTTTTTKYEHDPQHLSESVPRETALELLYEYVVEERRFPHEAEEVPVK